LKALLLGVTAVLLVGCGKFYWGKPGAGIWDFTEDHNQCVQSVALTTKNREYGMVPKDLYRACMKGRGWRREQHVEPVTYGWFRGIEDEEVVRIDSLPRQPERASPSDPLPPCERGATITTARDSQGRWRCRLQ
jgi:hypothetical protein